MTWRDIPRNPSRKTLRQFAALCLVVFGLLGCRALLQGGAWRGAAWLALALGLGVPGLLRPRLLRPIFVGWMVAVFPIGWMVSHVLLAAVYYGVLAPLGLVFRLRGRDPLRLKGRGQATYWTVKPAPASAAHYYRQF